MSDSEEKSISLSHMRVSHPLMLIGALASGINGLLGAWTMIAPIATGDLSGHNPDVWATLTLGGIVMTLGMTRALAPEELPVLSWVNLAAGVCILVSPWLMRFAANEDRMWTAVAVGGTVMILAALSAKVTLLMRHRLLRV